jgi:predicted O-methyltransferase YrrM
MKARSLMGYQKSQRLPGKWKTVDGGERPPSAHVLHAKDVAVFKNVASQLQAKTVLEFGPGLSTEALAGLGLQVTTVEHDQHWYEVAKERFKDNPNVRVLKGEDEMPFLVPDLDPDEKFDFAFVDAPQGYFPRRKIHKGYEDCSRFNTALFALQRAPVVLMHDVIRPLERGTLCRLNRMGYHFDLIRVPYGMARITHGRPSGLDLPRTEELGGTSPGPSP